MGGRDGDGLRAAIREDGSRLRRQRDDPVGAGREPDLEATVGIGALPGDLRAPAARLDRDQGIRQRPRIRNTWLLDREDRACHGDPADTGRLRLRTAEHDVPAILTLGVTGAVVRPLAGNGDPGDDLALEIVADAPRAGQ